MCAKNKVRCVCGATQLVGYSTDGLNPVKHKFMAQHKQCRKDMELSRGRFYTGNSYDSALLVTNYSI